MPAAAARSWTATSWMAPVTTACSCSSASALPLQSSRVDHEHVDVVRADGLLARRPRRRSGARARWCRRHRPGRGWPRQRRRDGPGQADILGAAAGVDQRRHDDHGDDDDEHDQQRRPGSRGTGCARASLGARPATPCRRPFMPPPPGGTAPTASGAGRRRRADHRCAGRRPRPRPGRRRGRPAAGPGRPSPRRPRTAANLDQSGAGPR